jgi:hypothetical protein
MLTFVTVSVNPTSGSKPSLPSTIANTWVFDLKRLVLQDILAGRFGAQRHSLSSYTIMYRLDVMPEVLCQAAALAEAEVEATENKGFPSFDEILQVAKVWLSFEENVDNAEVCISWLG